MLRTLVASAGLAAIGGGAGMGRALAAPPKAKIDTPVIACVFTGSQASITVQACSGATGLPAGFSLQWMTQADYIANGGVWFSSEDPRLCKASFSGNANISRYILEPGECTTVAIGDTLLDNGASTNCPDPLECDTILVIHAFGHATNKLMRSNGTGDLVCHTVPCDGGDSCTYTQGYWKTHGPIPVGNNANEWPVASLTLGTVLYTDLQLLSILDKAAAGNGLLTLAHQLIPAKLNVANQADDTAIAAAIMDADAMIGGLVVPPVGTGTLATSATSALVVLLTAYNEGATGPGHCQ